MNGWVGGWVKDGLTMHLRNFGVKILITFLLISQLLCKTQGCALDM